MDYNFSIDSILGSFKNLYFQDILKDFFGRAAALGKQFGRIVTGQLLCLYYVLKKGNLSVSEKAWIYAVLAYVLFPGDLIPRRIFHLLGITDDALAIAYVITKVRKRVTPQIELEVAMQLDKWFGYETRAAGEL